MKKRNLIRIISIVTALFAVTLVFAIDGNIKAQKYETLVEYNYQKSLDDLGTYIDNISSALNKGIYYQSPTQISLLSAKLFREAGSAKASLSSLPIYDLNLEGTYKFLSQVGEYAIDLSKRVAESGTISAEDSKNLDMLNEYASNLSTHIWNVIDDFNKSNYTLSEVVLTEAQVDKNGEAVPSMADGFRDMEDGFENYPTLIYDGPFSDHLMNKTAKLTKNKSLASEDYALTQVAYITDIAKNELHSSGEEESNLPLFCYENGDSSVFAGVTQYGGIPAYMFKSRDITSRNINLKDAENRASEYLLKLGFNNMRHSYYEVSDNLMIINYAHKVDGVLVYPDLIKVGVALDNGEVVFFDARGYIMNHKTRTTPTPKIELDEAQTKLSPKLTVKSSGVAIIPTSGENEVLCYEFLCTGEDEQHILVYINALTGEEENILLLIENENGVLTI